MNEEKITKQDIREIVKEAIESFAHIVNQGFTEQANFFNEKIDGVKTELKKTKIELLESNEKIATEIKDMREENATIIGGRQRIDNTLLGHGDRITDLEIHTKIKQKGNMA